MKNVGIRAVRGLVIGAIFGIVLSSTAWGTIWFWPMFATFTACGAGVAAWLGPCPEPGSAAVSAAGSSAWRGLVIGQALWTAITFVWFSRTMSSEEALTALVSSWLLMALLGAALGAIVGLSAPWVHGARRQARR